MPRSWADEIKKHYKRPEERLRLARRHLPRPAAFREASIALRAMIRLRRKASEPHDDLLGELYRLAAQHSLLHSAADPEPDAVPARNTVTEAAREAWLILEFPYDRLGYRHLQLLSKTDIKWLVEAWGEPAAHRTSRDLERDLWTQSVDMAIEALRGALKVDSAKQSGPRSEHLRARVTSWLSKGVGAGRWRSPRRTGGHARGARGGHGSRTVRG